MKDNYILTAESVTEGHPDKLCDTIADAVVDACLKHDPTARVACDEVDLVLFFRDPLRADSGSSNEQNLLRLCDMHSVPIATNIATAEVLLRGMDQGDLDYREGMHPPVIEPLAAPRRAVC